MWNLFKRRIEIFVRHCHFSEISAHKKTLPGVTRQKCFENFLKTIQGEAVNVTFLLDTFHPTQEKHFLFSQKQFPIIEISEGTEAGSFLRLLELASSRNFHPDTILYFLEDDYLHKEGWVHVLHEGFTTSADYVTLFDHRDKYFHPLYQDLQSQLFHTPSCHWRTTPSTTNTFALRAKTLARDLSVHQAFSQGVKISKDHEKFLALGARGAKLISSVPGWSTHNEAEFASPCTAWI